MKHNTFYKNTLWQYGLQILKHLFPLLLIPYLTRILGTEGYAVYAYLLSFMGVVQTIADFGFTLSGTKKVVDLRGDTAALSRLVGAITVARLMLLCGLFFCVMVVTRFIPIMAENTVYVIWAFFATAGRTVLPDFIFQGNERMGPLTTRYFASKGVQVALTILLVRGPGDLILVAVADVLSEIVDIVWSYRAQKRLFGVGIARPTFKESFEELRVSAIYCVSNVSSSLFSGFTTVIIGLAITSKTDIAFWSLTLTTVNAVQSLYTPIANSLYPHMIKNRDFGFARKLALVALPVLVLGIVAYCALSKPIMLVLGGPEYVGGAHVMWMISPIFIFSFYGILIGWPVLGAMGHVKELTVSTLFTGIVNVVSLLALYLAGLITLDVICVARWGCDALLLLVRVFMLWRVARSKTDFHKNPKE